MADLLAWLFVILVVGGLVVGIIGLLLPIILFALGFGLAVLAFSVLAWVLGRVIG